MKRINQSGNVTLNILLVIMLLIIAILIYILAGGEIPKINRSTGIQSPDMQTQQMNTDQQSTEEFSDGLVNPSFSEEYPLDEFGTGISERDIFDIDINADGLRDRITRTRNENGTSHFYYQYKIEINKNGDFIDITPEGFRTTEGTECSLQKLQFKFAPEFSVIKISRNWQDSWDTPTMATKTIYKFNNDALSVTDTQQLNTICDVKDLF